MMCQSLTNTHPPSLCLQKSSWIRLRLLQSVSFLPVPKVRKHFLGVKARTEHFLLLFNVGNLRDMVSLLYLGGLGFLDRICVLCVFKLDASWHCVALHGAMWHYMALCGTTWHYVAGGAPSVSPSEWAARSRGSPAAATRWSAGATSSTLTARWHIYITYSYILWLWFLFIELYGKSTTRIHFPRGC